MHLKFVAFFPFKGGDRSFNILVQHRDRTPGDIDWGGGRHIFMKRVEPGGVAIGWIGNGGPDSRKLFIGPSSEKKSGCCRCPFFNAFLQDRINEGDKPATAFETIRSILIGDPGP